MGKCFPELFAACVFLVCSSSSCTKEEHAAGSALVCKTFTLGCPTRTSLVGDGVNWNRGDLVAVWDGAAQRKFEVTGSGPVTSISGFAEEAREYSFKYPYNPSDSWTGTAVQTTVPVSQTPVTGGFDPEANILCAIGVEGNGASLLNACGLIRFSISGSDVTSVRITSRGGECFTGNITVSASGDSLEVTGADNNSILVETGTGGALAPGTYNICAAPAVLSSGIELRIARTDGSIGRLEKATPMKIVQAGIVTVQTPVDEAGMEIISDPSALTDAVLDITRPHPYLFADEAEFSRHRSVVASGRYRALTLMHREVIETADRIVSSGKVMKYELDESGKRILSTARDFLGRVFILSYAYRYTGELKYLAAAETLLSQICDFEDWNAQRHYLDPATITQGVSVAYDWLYGDLTEETRGKIEMKVFGYCLTDCLTRAAPYLDPQDGWNQTVTAGLIMGATAFHSVNPTLCNDILKSAVPSCHKGVRAKFGPDGSYPSGTEYWKNSTQTLPLAVSALRSIYGSDLGISDYSGYRLTPNWYIWMRGNTDQMFSFGDSGTSVSLIPGMFYFSALFGSGSYPYFEMLAAESGIVRSGGAGTPTASVGERAYPLFLLWASKAVGSLSPEAMSGNVFSATAGEQPVAAVRTGWNREDFYLAIKGGDGTCNHAHLDAGSICFDAWGQRWAADAVQDSYAKIEAAIAKLGSGSLWDVSAGSMRWKCFSINNRQHSTITVNDTDHYVGGDARVTEVYDEAGKLGAKVDFNDIFKGELKSATRTAVIKDNSYLEVRDRIEALDTRDAAVRWNLCSKASSAEIVEGGIRITAGGVSALLSATSSYPIEYALFTNDPKLAEHPSPFCEVEDVRTDYTYCGFRVTVPAGCSDEIVVTIVKL